MDLAKHLAHLSQLGTLREGRTKFNFRWLALVAAFGWLAYVLATSKLL
jgi:hypothetical protein